MLWFMKMVARRPHLLAASLLSVILATTFIVSTFIGVDLTVYATLEETLSKVKIDMKVFVYDLSASISSKQIRAAINELLKLDEVVSVDAILHMQFYSADKQIVNINGKTFNGTFFFLGFYDEPDVLSIVGSVPSEIPNGSLVLDYRICDKINATNSSRISLKILTFENKTLFARNFTLMEPFYEQPNEFVQAFFQTPIFVFSTYSREENLWKEYQWVLMNFSDLFNFLRNLSVGYYYYEELTLPGELVFLIKLDKTKIVDPWDPDISSRRLSVLESRIRGILRDVLGQENIAVQDDLRWALLSAQISTSQMRSFFSLFTLPVLVMGAFLAYLISWIFINERKKEIGLLKVRGLSNKKLKILFLIEFSLVGALGGFLASVISLAFAPQLALNVFHVSVPVDVILRFVHDAWTSYAILATVIGFILAFIATYYPAKSAASLEISKALYEYVEELEIEKLKTRRHFILLSIGAFGLLELLTGNIILALVVRYVMNAPPRFFFIAFLFIIFLIFDLFATIVGPFFFAYSALRLVTHYSVKTAPYLGKLIRPFAKDLSDIIAKNLLRKPKRTALVGFLVVLLIGTSLAFNIAAYTQLSIKKAELKYRIGADIKVDTLYGNPTSILSAVDNISNLTEIKHLVRFRVVKSEELEYSRGYMPVVARYIAVDPDYFDAVSLSQRCLEGISVEEAKKVLQSESLCLASIAAKDYGYDINDKVTVDFGGKTVNLTIKGFFKFLPGIAYSVEEPQVNLLFIFNWKVLPYSGETVTLLIKLVEGANATNVADKISEILAENKVNYREILVYAEGVKKLEEEAATAIVYRFSNYMFVFSFIIALFGIALAMVMAAIERRREIALMRAKGLSTEQILIMFLAEGVLIIILSLALGLPIAIGYASLVLPKSATQALAMNVYIEYPPEYTIYVPISSMIAFATFVVGILLSALIPAYLVSKRNIVSELRIVK